MMNAPEFPEFKPVDMGDREVIQKMLDRYQPQTSEWTFTNLFIWRSHYGFEWSFYKDWLLVICTVKARGFCAIQPVGPPSRVEVTKMLLNWLQDEKGEENPSIERADSRLISELQDAQDLLIEPTRDQFDYVYRTEDLIRLAGRKYHSKKNHINRFLRSRAFTHDAMIEKYIDDCSNLAETWCQWHRCEEDMNLLDEWEAVREALENMNTLKLQGGVILIEGKVQAFALGEFLNRDSSVVHIEKANPEIPELYAVINQQCCEKSWPQTTYVNREQDLGEQGLRKAKLSYHPDHLEEKFSIRQTQ